MTTQLRCDGQHNEGDHEIQSGEEFYSVDFIETDRPEKGFHEDYCIDTGSMKLMQLANLFNRNFLQYITIRKLKA